MSHYLLFIPDTLEPSGDMLTGLGLKSLCDGPPQFYALCGAGGPDGRPGQIVLVHECPDIAHQDRNPAPGYFPEHQEWRRHPDGHYWVGWSRENPPRPEDLARPVMLDGPILTMGDGRQWQLPNAFAQEARLAVGPGGVVMRRSQYLHADLYADAVRMVEAVEKQLRYQAGTEGGEPLNVTECWRYVCGLLARNYRLNEFIIGELGLIVEERLAVCVAVTTDIQRLRQLEMELSQGN